MIEARGQLIRVLFPDDNHARLYDLGKRIEDGPPIEPRELQQVFKTWRGFAQDDRDAGAPIASWHDVPDFALDMLHDADDAAAGAAMFGRDWSAVAFYVDPALARYVARCDVPEERLELITKRPEPRRPSTKAQRPMQLSLFDSPFEIVGFLHPKA
jgi:hypothetical protein